MVCGSWLLLLGFWRRGTARADGEALPLAVGFQRTRQSYLGAQGARNALLSSK